MPAPAHLAPILERLGDGGSVHVAQVVHELVEEAKAQVRAELMPPPADDVSTTAPSTEAVQGLDSAVTVPGPDDYDPPESDTDWDDGESRLDEPTEDATSNPEPTPETPQAVDGPVEPSSAEYRAWAAANGIDCPDRGRIPQAVKDAYTAAREG